MAVSGVTPAANNSLVDDYAALSVESSIQVFMTRRIVTFVV